MRSGGFAVGWAETGARGGVPRARGDRPAKPGGARLRSVSAGAGRRYLSHLTGGQMITGTHAIVFTTQVDEARAFFRDKLGFASVDAGGGWLIFALPPAELGVHPIENGGHHELYLMCDDIEATVEDLK